MLITKESQPVTYINVFSTRPEQQQELLENWSRRSGSAKGEPGMLGIALHRSRDATRVVSYAQWRSEEDLNCFRKKFHKHIEALGPFAERVDPHIYEVVYLHEQAGR